jgi:hypothetical protein
MAAAVAALGFLLVAYPERVQQYVLRTQSDSWAWKVNPFRDWMRRPSYRTYLRFMGFFALLWAALVIAAVLFSLSSAG